MKLGRVAGTVVATRKDPSLESLKLLVVENMTTTLEREGVVFAWDGASPRWSRGAWAMCGSCGSSGPG